MSDPPPPEPSAQAPGLQSGVHDEAQTPRRFYKGKISVQPGKPIEISERDESVQAHEDRPEVAAIGETLSAYLRSAKQLIEGRYRELADFAPIHMRVPCDCWAIVCDDGIIVRWDRNEGEEKPKVRIAWPQEGATTISALVPGFSERHIYCPTELTNFELPSDGQRIQLSKVNSLTGEQTPLVEARIGIIVNWTDIQNQPAAPSTRPVPVVSVVSELEIQIGGEQFDESAETRRGTGQEFLLTSRIRLPVGWEAFEIYPPFDPAIWRPGAAKDWAELDLLAAAARHNVRQQQLHDIDPRAATRREYRKRLKAFQALLNGPEADLQEFLENNPELLSPTHLRVWKKVPLGQRKTDFVFREPPNEYLLVELEAPTRSLFRKDGQQHEDLTHAINQVLDWLRYIQDNPDTVHRELGLEGISPHPQCLIVIGRSARLTDQDRRKLATLQGSSPRLRILTYDDLLVTATQSIGNLLGPIWDVEGTAEIYYRWGS